MRNKNGKRAILKQPYMKLLPLILILVLSGSGQAQVVDATMEDSRFGAQEPLKVLETLERAVLKRDFSAYRSVLADSFVYVPGDITEAMYPNIDWKNWDITTEEGFLQQILSPVLKAELHLTDEITERGMPIDQRALFQLTYLLKIGGRPYISEASFHFVESDKRWYLWKWEEKAPVSNPNGGGFFSNSGEVRASLAP